jgi:hypothetical protein
MSDPTSNTTGHQRRINAAMAHLDQRAEGGRCGEMVAEMLAAADAVLLERLPMMRDANGVFWVELAALEGLLQHA